MKRSWSISAKIWLSLSILVLGYFILVFLSFHLEKYMKKQLVMISDVLMPVSQQSELAYAAFTEQIKLYNDAIMMGEPSLVESARTYAERSEEALRRILALRGLDEEQQQRVQQTLNDLTAFTTSAQIIYQKLSSAFTDTENETNEHTKQIDTALQDQAIALGQETEILLNDLHQLVDYLEAKLRHELESIHAVTGRYGKINMAVSLIVVFSALTLIAIIIKRSIIHPLWRIVNIAERITAGEENIRWLPESRDEIGTLNTSLRTMTENLRAEIKERKRAELSLLQTEKKFQAIFENSLEGIFQMRPDGRIFNANPALAHIMGYASPQELLATTQHFLEQMYVSREELNRFQQILHEEGQVIRFEAQIYCHNGAIIWVSISARTLRDPMDKVLYYEGSLMDITERKQAEALQHAYKAELEREVKERTQELSQALEHLTTAQRELIQAEKMAALGQLIAGVAHEINTPLGAIRASMGHISSALQETMKQLPPLLRSLSPEYQKRFCELTQHALASKQNLTSREERKLRRALRRNLEEQAIDEAEMFADTLVDMGIYDNFIPFLPLLTDERNTEILQAAYNLTSQQHHSQNILVAVERASKVVFALKNYAHYDHSDAMTKSNVAEGIDIVLTLYHNQLKHGVEVMKRYQPLPEIACYPDELNQVWTNIIHNAIQAMNGEGQLEISVSQCNENIVAEFIDSGCGIPPEIQQRIFEPFFTTKIAGEGSGLGLDIVKKIIEKHDGRIEVQSQPGRTMFRVFLPMMEMPSEPLIEQV